MAAPRKDAARNRELLIDAAREVFSDRGADAPLEVVARAAGVSRTTLHRHFADRSALVASVLEENVRRIEARAAELDEDPLGAVVLVHEMLDDLVRAPWLAAVVGDAEAAGMSERVLAALEPLAAEAQQHGLTHPGVGAREMLLVLPMAMAASAAAERTPRPQDEGAATEQAVRAVLHRGLFTTAPPGS
ncbi:TetR/AcrR family transcriptional regulator [Brachybacterium phenoliresistens]|uniref:TetR family transcriptional regulator n=1 Tax=Brachybacterium phenoliresistens TaxID=396014 RepID=Z9JWS4_9MICO|nr:helix-turn-helix domain-containing protein [Brachybacterium phenoliresistens]EWS82624.1 TetR family transcriptional regulator [Brachybacterium phenoliresistens]